MFDYIIKFFLTYKWAIIFYTLVIFLIYINRKKFDFQAKFVGLYRTKVGLKFMDKISTKYRELVKLIAYCGIGVAYIGLLVVSFFLIKETIKLIFNVPGAAGAAPVVPGFPIAGLGIVFPLIMGWICLFIILVVHEFSHGVVARAFNIKILSSGLAFFGPLFGAFVEPDEKEISKRPDIEQYSVFSAGPVSNILLGLVAFLVMGYLLMPAVHGITEPGGIQIGIQEDLAADKANIPANSIITQIDDTVISDSDAFVEYAKTIEPGQTVTVYTKEGSHQLTTTLSPKDNESAYFGIYILSDFLKPKNNLIAKPLFLILGWFKELLSWLFIISIGVALINLFPLFITDGARMLRTTLLKIMKDKNKALFIWSKINIVGVTIILFLLLFPLLRNLVKLIVPF
jgi:membrane-associated protease RseP (regulator of RpoE activity)